MLPVIYLLLKEIDGEEAAFLCVNGMRMLPFSVDIGVHLYIFFYNPPFNPYYGNKLKIRWGMNL
ncbi:hypothetical protein CEQ83_26435 (plasmid) [Priestia megaterium]|nr:hypothetical protein CEQ83_26435 [Priestia megaterium]